MDWQSVVFKGGPRQPLGGERPELVALVEPTARLIPTLAILIIRRCRGMSDAVMTGYQLAAALTPGGGAAVLHARIVERQSENTGPLQGC
jgi:hypothetical protein